MGILRGLRDRPHLLELAYRLVEKGMEKLHPLVRRIGYARANRWLRSPEKIAKQAIFDCKMCGQCTLHFTGMTCPMTCPKNLRNGPCGGVRGDKTCEVDPGMLCVWVEAYERSRRMSIYGDGINHIQPPRNFLLAKRSAFINILSLKDAEQREAWDPYAGISRDRN
jgi:hypothetical protein